MNDVSTPTNGFLCMVISSSLSGVWTELCGLGSTAQIGALNTLSGSFNHPKTLGKWNHANSYKYKYMNNEK